MYFTQNPRQRIHCTSDIHSSGKDYQNLKDVYEWMRNNEHEKIEVNLTFYRERFLIDLEVNYELDKRRQKTI